MEGFEHPAPTDSDRLASPAFSVLTKCDNHYTTRAQIFDLHQPPQLKNHDCVRSYCPLLDHHSASSVVNDLACLCLSPTCVFEELGVVQKERRLTGENVGPR